MSAFWQVSWGVKKATQILTWNVSPTISEKLSSTQMDQLLLHVFQTFLQLLLCPVAQRENLGSMINGFVSSGWFSLTNPLVVVYLEIVNVLPFTVLNSFLNVCAVYLVAKLLVSHVAVGKLGCNHHENLCKFVETSLQTQGEITQLRIMTKYCTNWGAFSWPIHDIPFYSLVSDRILFSWPVRIPSWVV